MKPLRMKGSFKVRVDTVNSISELLLGLNIRCVLNPDCNKMIKNCLTEIKKTQLEKKQLIKSIFLNPPKLCFNVISFIRDENLHIPTHPANTGGEYCGILDPVLIHSNSLAIKLNFIFREFVYSRKSLKVLQKSVTV